MWLTCGSPFIHGINDRLTFVNAIAWAPTHTCLLFFENDYVKVGRANATPSMSRHNAFNKSSFFRAQTKTKIIYNNLQPSTFFLSLGLVV